MSRTRHVGLLVVGALALSSASVYATMPIQKKAKDAGIAAVTCQYCHVEALPKKTAFTLNARGKWLVAEKERRNKAAEIDGAWLKDYKEPAK